MSKPQTEPSGSAAGSHRPTPTPGGAAGHPPDEAGGLVDSWRDGFLRAPGARFPPVMSAAEYDAFCAVQIVPTPTEMARVGLVWTEFTPAAGPAK